MHENCADLEVGAVGHPARDERIPGLRRNGGRREPDPARDACDDRCFAGGKLTKPYHPWTTDVIDKSFLCGAILPWRTGDRVAKSRG